MDNHWIQVSAPLLHLLVGRIDGLIYKVAERPMMTNYRDRFEQRVRKTLTQFVYLPTATYSHILSLGYNQNTNYLSLTLITI